MTVAVATRGNAHRYLAPPLVCSLLAKLVLADCRRGRSQLDLPMFLPVVIARPQSQGASWALLLSSGVVAWTMMDGMFWPVTAALLMRPPATGAPGAASNDHSCWGLAPPLRSNDPSNSLWLLRLVPRWCACRAANHVSHVYDMDCHGLPVHAAMQFIMHSPTHAYLSGINLVTRY